jgi:2-phosphosulfolactate phosphatase
MPMQIRIASLIEGAAQASGTAIIIDVFRAFTTAAIAFRSGAERIAIVGTIDEALALRRSGLAEISIGERGGRTPPGFDFGNSPAAISRAVLAGKRLVQTTSNGTAALLAAQGAERLYAAALVNAEATARAVLRQSPALVTIVAAGRSGGVRADEDELCALYLRARLEGRQPDRAALGVLLATLPPPPDPDALAAGDYDPRDRELAATIDAAPLAIRVRAEGAMLMAFPDHGT